MDNQQEKFKKNYPEEEYEEKEFSISNKELMRLIGLDAIAQNGQIAQTLMTNFFNQVVIPRVGAKNSQDVGLLYDLSEGTFKLFTPKVWCANCSNRKGILELNGKKYCKECFILENMKIAKEKNVEETPEPPQNNS